MSARRGVLLALVPAPFLLLFLIGFEPPPLLGWAWFLLVAVVPALIVGALLREPVFIWVTVLAAAAAGLVLGATARDPGPGDVRAGTGALRTLMLMSILPAIQGVAAYVGHHVGRRWRQPARRP